MAVSLNTALGAFPITALAGTGYVPLAGGTMTGALTIASGTLTASAPALNITQTWNNAGVVFNALSIVTTNTGSSSQSKFASFSNSDGGIINFFKQGWIEAGNASARSSIDSTGITVGSTSALGFSSNALASAVQDTYFSRDVAGGMGLRNGANQQSFCVYNNESFSLTNYERLKLTGVAGTSVNITAETLGTGADNLHLVLQSAGTGLIKFFLNGAQRAYIDTDGYYTGIGIVGTGGKFILSDSLDLRMDPTLGVKWTASGGYSGTVDSGLMRGAAGQVDVTNGTAGTFRDVKLRNLLNTEYHQMTEMTAPHAPATKSVRIYAEDNGSGKTRLMALFATGAAQQLAIEP